MKDWRGVLLELAIIGALVFALALDHSLAPMIVGVLAAWGGTIIQRAKFDALAGTSSGGSVPPGGSLRSPPGGAQPRECPFPRADLSPEIVADSVPNGNARVGHAKPAFEKSSKTPH